MPVRPSSLTPSDDMIAVDTRRVVERLRVRAWAIAAGLVGGVALGAATLVLVLRGGPQMGAHLGLLSVYLPGYSVSYVGTIVGFVYAFFVGTGTPRSSAKYQTVRRIPSCGGMCGSQPNLGIALRRIIHAARADRIHVAPVRLRLRVDQWNAVDLRAPTFGVSIGYSR